MRFGSADVEKLAVRAAQIASRRAALRRERLAARLKELEPLGVRMTEEGDGIVLAGRGLARRYALDPRSTWSVMEASDEG
jgi:hypothetical protein